MSFMDVVDHITRGIWGDGAGRGLGFDLDLVTKSAAYNKMSGYAKDVISAGLSNDVITKESADSLKKLLDSGDEEAFTKVTADVIGSLGGIDNDTAKKVVSNFTENVDKYTQASTTADYAEFLGKNTKDGIGIGNMASGYFGDAQHGKMRRQVAIGAGVGVGVATRVLSGGTLTQTNTGERDIAGIPFI